MQAASATGPPGGEDEQGDDVVEPEEVVLFRRTRWLNLAGGYVATASIVTFTWDVSDHAVMWRYLLAGFVAMTVTGILYVVPLRRPVERLPPAVYLGFGNGAASLSLAIFLEPAEATSQEFALGVAAVLFACVAGTLATMTIIPKLLRTGVGVLLGPFIVGCSILGHWAIAAGTTLFGIIVIVFGVANFAGWYDELKSLRGEAAQRAAVAEETAQRDPLTGLFNRRGMASRIEGRSGGGLAALYLDLDGFKAVNDGHGHAAGDRVLTTVADRLRSTCRDGDVIGRLGGDEFVVVIGTADLDRAAILADRLIDSVTQPVALDDTTEVTVGLSVGLATVGELDLESLLHAADRAQYRAKQSGGNRAERATAADAPAG